MYTGKTPVSMSIIMDEMGNDVPAMPDDVFAMVPTLKVAWQHYQTNLKYRETSMVTAWKVSCMPIKPQACNMPAGIWKQAIENRANSLFPLHPVGLIAANIGKNVGLARIMRDHYENNKQNVQETARHPRPCPNYSAFNVDIDIFRRLLKVNSQMACGKS